MNDDRELVTVELNYLLELVASLRKRFGDAKVVSGFSSKEELGEHLAFVERLLVPLSEKDAIVVATPPLLPPSSKSND